jgi:sulfur-oxidizing protein SoxA
MNNTAHVAAAAVLWLSFLTMAMAQSRTAADPRRSGFEYMGPSTQAMQKDDTQNPAMLWIGEGEALWKQAAGSSQKACVACHAQASTSMKGVAARYPAFDERTQRPVTLGQRINQCRLHHQQATPFKDESQALLALESYVGLQSRGMPMSPPTDARLNAPRALGEVRFQQRMGQLNLSCAQCHTDNAGGKLGSALIPQAHPQGYPVYRLEWQGMGSLQRRLRNCMTGVRAEPFAYGAQELVELELYLAARSKGMAGETPAVRP